MAKILLRTSKGTIFADIDQLIAVTISDYICTFIFKGGGKFNYIET